MSALYKRAACGGKVGSSHSLFLVGGHTEEIMDSKFKTTKGSLLFRCCRAKGSMELTASRNVDAKTAIVFKNGLNSKGKQSIDS